jgi:hypothetical protein
MSHTPGCFVTSQIKQTHQIKYRRSGFVICQKVDHPEPLFQGGPGFMQNGTSSQGNLIITIFTLIQLSGRMKRIFFMITSWTFESIWPAFFKKKLIEPLVGGELALKLEKINEHRHHFYDIMYISTPLI